jgi:hypothetical protein
MAGYREFTALRLKAHPKVTETNASRLGRGANKMAAPLPAGTPKRGQLCSNSRKEPPLKQSFSRTSVGA